jgi:hypothetical protein
VSDPEKSTATDADAESNAEVLRRARSTRRHSRWSKVLAIVGAVLLPIAGLAFWSRNQLLNTGHYVDTIKPLASDPAVRAAVADRVTEAVSSAIDLQDRADEALPDRAKFLAGPIAAAGDNLIHQTALTVLESEQFQKLWEDINRSAHSQLVYIITGKNTNALSRSNGKVVVSLRPVADQVLQQVDKVVPVDLSNVDTSRLNQQFVLVDSDQLGQVQTGVKWFNRLTYALLIAAVAALVGAALIERDRRKGIQRVGLAVAISMAVALLAYRAGREIYVSNLPSEVTHPDAATAAFDIITRYIERGIEALLALGVVLFVVAWTLGPSRSAARLRGWWQRLRNRGSAELSNVEPAPVATWVAKHLNELRFAVVALAVVTLLLWGRPTGRVVILLAIVTVLLLAVISVVGGAVPAPSTEESSAEEPSDTEPTDVAQV